MLIVCFLHKHVMSVWLLLFRFVWQWSAVVVRDENDVLYSFVMRICYVYLFVSVSRNVCRLCRKFFVGVRTARTV